jgi:hypothetical protein
MAYTPFNKGWHINTLKNGMNQQIDNGNVIAI